MALFEHSGRLRILQSLYPEGEGICHNVIVHPPGGLIGGDTLDLGFNVAAGAHGLVTTPGATRFYRSDGAPALQRTQLQLAAGARLEWLPLEAIAYPGRLAENRLTMDLALGAELIGWDVTAFGLPAAHVPFDAPAVSSVTPTGQFSQHIELPGVWLERASDALLLGSPLGLAGYRCMATLFLATGTPAAGAGYGPRRAHRAPAVRHRRRDQPRQPDRGGAGAVPHGGARARPAQTGAQRLARRAVGAAR